MSPADKTEERKGFLILGAGSFFFSIFALSGKALSPEITPAQMIVVRSAIMLPILVLWALKRGDPIVGEKKLLLFLRGFIGSLALFCFFFALRRLPLADTVLIFQAHPLIVACLAPLFLKENNLRIHWIFLCISFCGVALVVGPTGAGTWEGRLSAFTCCLLASFVAIVVRYLRRTEHTLTIAISFPMVSLFLFGPLVLLGVNGFEWVQPLAADWALLIVIAITASLGQVLVTLGLGKVPAARGTALSNLQVAFALIYGMVFFSEMPGWITLVGAVIIICAQVFLVTSSGKRIEKRGQVI